MKRYGYVSPDDFETAERNGICQNTVESRVYYQGWDVDRAITEPPLKRRYLTAEQKATAKANGLRLNTVHRRILSGMDPDEAVRQPVASRLEINRRICEMNRTRFTQEQVKRAEENGICYSTLFARVNNLKWDVETAINTPVLTLGEVAKRASVKSPFRELNELTFKRGKARTV